jgi:NAD(P)-dependent dehydrogenase (short-subunit alcohol dehydrogenase family)
MFRFGGGAIVNIVSIHGFGAVVLGLSIYTASKQAPVGLTKAAALGYAQTGIRINVVAPVRHVPSGWASPRNLQGPLCGLLPLCRLS